MKLFNRERKESKATFYVRSAESVNGGAHIPGASADSGRLAMQIRDRIREDQNGHKDEIDRLLDSMGVKYETQPPHRKFMQWVVRKDSYGDEYEEIVHSERGAADLVSSETIDGNHAPVIDLDFPCRLYPSGTKGHFHLYLDREMSWDKFDGLLKAFVDAGLVEKEFHQAAKRRHYALVRLPEKPKTEEERIVEERRKQLANAKRWTY